MTKTSKTIQTRQNIQNALISLMETQSFNTITIANIVKEAGLNRSTFYRYFDDKYTLVEEIENEIINHLENTIISQGDLLLSDSDKYDVLFHVLSYFSKEASIATILLGENGDPSFVHKLTKSIKEHFPIGTKEAELPSKYMELVNDVKASAVIHFLSKFDTYLKKYTIEEIAYFFSLM